MFHSNDSRSWNNTTCTTCLPVQDPCASNLTSNYKLVVEVVCADCQTLTRVRTVDPVTNTIIGSDQFYTSTGTTVSAPAQLLLGACQNQVVTSYYTATSPSTGVETGNRLRQLRTICQPSGVVLYESWFNESGSGAVIPKPPAGTIAPVDTNLDGVLLKATYRSRVPLGNIPNGVITQFSLPDAPDSSTLTITKNGMELNPGSGADYQVSGTSISFTTPPLTGAILRATYFTA